VASVHISRIMKFARNFVVTALSYIVSDVSGEEQVVLTHGEEEPIAPLNVAIIGSLDCNASTIELS